MLYNKVLTLKCNASKITLGNIPNNIVGINKDINSINSLLFISLRGFKLSEYLPYDILLYKYILYIAESTIPDAPNMAIIGLLNHIPIKDSCSPKKFKDNGIPVLANVKIKNKIVNRGI